MHYNNDLYHSDWPNMQPISVNMQNGSYGMAGNINFGMFFNEKDEVVRMSHFGGILDAYTFCPPLASILNMCADAFINADFWALNKNTENDVRGIKKEWQRLLDEPNPHQDSRQFFKQLYIYRKLYGWCYVYKRKLSGFTKPELYVLPPYMMRIEPKFKRSFFDRADNIRKVFLCFNGYELELKKEEIILFTDNSVVLNRETLLPESRFLSEERNINTIIAALDAEEGLIRRKGAIGILSNGNTGADAFDATAITNTDKLNIQRDYERYGLNTQQMKVIITEYPLRWQQMSFDVKELGIHEAILGAIKGLCDAANFPFILSAFSDQSTYNNVATADRRLYQNNIIPDSKSIMATLTKGVGSVETDNTILVADYEKVAALQQSNKEKGEGMHQINKAMDIAWKANLIRLNEWRESLNMNKLTDEEGGNLFYHEYNKKFGIAQITTSGQGENTNTDPDEEQGNANEPNNS